LFASLRLSARCFLFPIMCPTACSGFTCLRVLHSSPTRRSSDLLVDQPYAYSADAFDANGDDVTYTLVAAPTGMTVDSESGLVTRSEEHTSELQSRENHVCRLLREKKKSHPQRSTVHVARNRGLA